MNLTLNDIAIRDVNAHYYLPTKKNIDIMVRWMVLGHPTLGGRVSTYHQYTPLTPQRMEGTPLVAARSVISLCDMNNTPYPPWIVAWRSTEATHFFSTDPALLYPFGPVRLNGQDSILSYAFWETFDVPQDA